MGVLAGGRLSGGGCVNWGLLGLGLWMWLSSVVMSIAAWFLHVVGLASASGQVYQAAVGLLVVAVGAFWSSTKRFFAPFAVGVALELVVAPALGTWPVTAGVYVAAGVFYWLAFRVLSRYGFWFSVAGAALLASRVLALLILPHVLSLVGICCALVGVREAASGGQVCRGARVGGRQSCI